jgi:signal transduction histidine kinase
MYLPYYLNILVFLSNMFWIKTCLAVIFIFITGIPAVYSQTAEQILTNGDKLYKQNKYDLAQKKYLQVIQLAGSENNFAVKAKASLSLARCHYFLYDHQASYKWTYDALYTIKKYQIDSLLPEANYFLGVLYIEDENIDSAEKYSFKAIELMLSEKNYAGLSQTYSTLAELHLNTGRSIQTIEKMILNAEKYAALSHDKGMMAFAYSKRYNFNFFLKKDYKEALKYITQAERLYVETGSREAILNAYRGKAECLIMLGDTLARTYMLKWFDFKDSVLQAEKAANIAKYETLYETEKKEEQNIELHRKNELNELKIQAKNRILVMMIVVFLFFVLLILFLYNRTRLRKKQNEISLLQKLQNDKERIARDLHDNVGGQLSYIIYSLDGINEEEAEKRKEVTQSLNESVRSVIGSLRETIWAISDANVPVQDFSDKLKVYVRTLFKHKKTGIHFSEDIKYPLELNALLGLNVYRICQEILTNAFKHSNANDVKIQIICINEKLKITISDNGKGFEITENNKEKMGLTNIRTRAAEFGISLSMNSKINIGTEFILEV